MPSARGNHLDRGANLRLFIKVTCLAFISSFFHAGRGNRCLSSTEGAMWSLSALKPGEFECSEVNMLKTSLTFFKWVDQWLYRGKKEKKNQGGYDIDACKRILDAPFSCSSLMGFCVWRAPLNSCYIIIIIIIMPRLRYQRRNRVTGVTEARRKRKEKCILGFHGEEGRWGGGGREYKHRNHLASHLPRNLAQITRVEIATNTAQQGRQGSTKDDDSLY